MIDLDLEMEGVDPLTMKEVIISGADQGGGLKRVASHPLFWLFFYFKSTEFSSVDRLIELFKNGNMAA